MEIFRRRSTLLLLPGVIYVLVFLGQIPLLKDALSGVVLFIFFLLPIMILNFIFLPVTFFISFRNHQWNLFITHAIVSAVLITVNFVLG